jgi:hypothetical protein
MGEKCPDDGGSDFSGAADDQDAEGHWFPV